MKISPGWKPRAREGPRAKKFSPDGLPRPLLSLLFRLLVERGPGLRAPVENRLWISLLSAVALNSGDYWPRFLFLKKAGTIRVRIRPPIHTAGRSARDVTAGAEEWIEAKVEE